jgi:type I restriction enzyme M protein
MTVAQHKPRRRKHGNDPAVPDAPQDEAPRFASTDETLDLGSLETWLWDAACAIRGATDAPKFKDYILPLVFFKRLSDVFDDQLGRPDQALRRRGNGAGGR